MERSLEFSEKNWINILSSLGFTKDKDFNRNSKCKCYKRKCNNG